MNKLTLPAWAVALVAAYAVSLETGVTATIGVAGQWLLNAPKRIDNRISVAVILAVTVGAYVALHWGRTLSVTDGAAWALAAVGAGSLAGKTGGAPPTNSL